MSEFYICPVCGYDKLEDPPENHEICPSCCCQFDYTDCNRSHEDLRAEWIAKGMPFVLDRYDWKPEGWNPIEQLKNIGVHI